MPVQIGTLKAGDVFYFVVKDDSDNDISKTAWRLKSAAAQCEAESLVGSHITIRVDAKREVNKMSDGQQSLTRSVGPF